MFAIVSKDDVPIYMRQFDSLVKESSTNHSKNPNHLKYEKQFNANPYKTVAQGPHMFDLLLIQSLD